MKTLSILLVFSILMLGLSSCKNDLLKESIPNIAFKDKFVSLDDKMALNNEMAKRIDSLTEVDFEVWSTELIFSKESSHYYLQSIAKEQNGKILTVAIPVDVIKKKNGDIDYLLDDSGCTHTCEASVMNPCSACSLTILENCKRQTCSCTSTSGGACSGSITLN